MRTDDDARLAPCRPPRPRNPAVAAAGDDAVPAFVVARGDPRDVLPALVTALDADSPRPVVDFDARATDTRERCSRLADRASEALEEPEIRRRASLSRRHETVDDDPDTTGQARLGDF